MSKIVFPSLLLLLTLTSCQEFFAIDHDTKPAAEVLVDAKPLIIASPIVETPFHKYVVTLSDSTDLPLTGQLITVNYREAGILKTHTDLTDGDGKISFFVPETTTAVSFEYGFTLPATPRPKKGDAPSLATYPNFSGNFAASTLTTTANSYGTIGSLVADFDGDGTLDIVTNFSGDSANFFWNDGSASFTRTEVFISSSVGFTYRTSLLDWNNDGKLDVALAYADGIYVLVNQGGRDFEVVKILENEAGKQIRDLKFVDLNQDSYLDLITISANSNRVVIYYGNKTGKFSRFTRYSHGHSSRFVEVHDFNQDGKLDLFIFNYKSSVTNLGSITVLKSLDNGLFELHQEINLSQLGYNLKLIDLDHDGVQEIVASTANRFQILKFNSSTSNYEFVMNGANTFTATASNTANDMVLVDSDNNGDWELMVIGANQYKVWNIPASTLVPVALAGRTKTGLTSMNYFSQIVDLNADGLPDVIAGSASAGNLTTVQVLLGQP